METSVAGHPTNPLKAITDCEAFASIRSIRRLEPETKANAFVIERFARLVLLISLVSVGDNRFFACFISAL